MTTQDRAALRARVEALHGIAKDVYSKIASLEALGAMDAYDNVLALLDAETGTGPHDLKTMASGLEEYVVWSGPIHGEDCPGDDTCDCLGKEMNKAANAACKYLKQLAGAESGTEPAQEPKP